MPIFEHQVDSPMGPIRLRAQGDNLTGLDFADPSGSERSSSMKVALPGVVTEAARQLVEYFEGSRTTFKLPLGGMGSEFQQRVWKEVSRIPYGDTASYSDIARALDLAAGASRAIGTANGANPLLIIVPCHRVVASDGSLTGYAAGIGRKQWLLAHEGASLF